MYKMLVKFAAILAVCSIGQMAGATTLVTPGIRGSDHDFSKFLMVSATGRALDEICIFCHAPHRNALPNLGGDDAPLWNHNVNNNGVYIPYTSLTLKAQPGQPNGTSKLCLGCHDGTIALEAYGKSTTGTHFISDPTFGTGSKVIGTDLTNDHPISFTYDAALVALDPEIRDMTAPILPGLNSETGTIADLLDRNGQVQCTTCHTPHNSQGINKLLRVNNTGSALCLTCHAK